MLSEKAIIRALLSVVVCDPEIAGRCVAQDAAFFGERLLKCLDPSVEYEEDSVDVTEVIRQAMMRAGYAQMAQVFVPPCAVDADGFRFCQQPDSTSEPLGDAYERLKSGRVVGGNLWSIAGDWADVFHLSGRLLVPASMLQTSRRAAEEYLHHD